MEVAVTDKTTYEPPSVEDLGGLVEITASGSGTGTAEGVNAKSH